MNQPATETQQEAVKSFSATKTPDAILADLHEPEERSTLHFFSRYGIRLSDGSMVVHFYRAKDGDGEHTTPWLKEFAQLLEDAILSPRAEGDERPRFDIAKRPGFLAGYTSDLDSYYVVAHPREEDANPWDVIEDFLDDLSARCAHAASSGT